MSKLSKKKLAIRIGIGVVLLLICAASAFAAFTYSSFQRITVKPTVATPLPSPSTEPEPVGFNHLKPYGFLLLGYGGGVHEGGKLSDSIMLVYIVPKDQKIFLISVPRDLWVALPTTEDQSTYWKINSAYAIGSDDRSYSHKPAQYTGPAGGGEMAKYAITTVTGLPVQHFAAIDFSGFTKTIDVLKGVDIKVERTFDDDLYPIEEKKDDSCGRSPEDIAAITATMSATKIEKEKMFPCRYEELHFDAGLTHMDGATALKYVRSRHSVQDGGDFNRAARQRNLLLAVKNRIFSLSFFPKIIPFITSLSYDVQTDMSVSDMEEFLNYKDDLSSYKITGIALTTQNILQETRSSNGQDILAPKDGIDNWDSVKQWLQDQMNPSPQVSDSPESK